MVSEVVRNGLKLPVTREQTQNKGAHHKDTMQANGSWSSETRKTNASQASRNKGMHFSLLLL